MKKTPLLALLFISALSLYGRDTPRYPVSDIPEELKKGTHAVIRDDEMVFTIHTRSTASLKVHFVVTLLDPNARHFARQMVWYDKLRKIVSFKAQVIDAEGKVTRKLKNNEITDHSAYDALFSDNRVKVADLTQSQYPYTVEFEYEVAYKFLYDIDGSFINGHEDVAVQRATYQLNFPEALRPRYKTNNVSVEPKYVSDGDMSSLTWSFENVPPPVFEPYADKLNTISFITAAPGIFEFEGYAGTMSSWDEYGQWIATLNAGRNALPEETKQKVKQIAAGLQTREEKVKALYEYMQNKTRYVSIQLGIGGYQPFEAEVVDRTGYGDCKALSNYMLALLETVDIKGHYALIMAGENARRLDTGFPSSQFNHAIVAVPNGADTIWLECTSQTSPFGYQGRFTGDRKALLITDDGAAVVNTTRYPADVNEQTTVANVTVTPQGNATASVERVYTGLQYENGGLNHVITKQADEQKKWLQRHLDIPAFDVASFSMRHIKDRIPAAVITAELKIDRFATISGKRIFLTPNLMNRNTFVPEKDEDRKQPIVRSLPYTDVDTIRYTLPEGIYPEFLPENVVFKSQFGEYEAQYQVEQGSVIYVRKVKMFKGEFPPSAYQEMVDFFRNVSRADNTKMVFMSKT